LPRYLREHFLDGLVVSATSEKRNEVLEEDFARYSIPSIFMNAVGEYNCISMDDHLGACRATRHLIELGHRSIMFAATASDHYSMVEREKGYRETLKAEGLEASVYVLEEGSREEKQVYERRLESNAAAGRQFLDHAYFKQRPTAVFCYDDRVALILMRALHDAGIDVPGEVSIVGFNDMPFMDMLPVPLTTVRADFHAMGCLAGHLLLDLIDNGEVRVPSPIIQPELVIRQSSGTPRQGRKIPPKP
jgi:DNA-binding LacI/PurR family transcriptional regulator